MKNQAKVSAPSAPVSSLSVAYNNPSLHLTRAVELAGHISLPAEFYEKYKDAEVFQKGVPRVEFHHAEGMIHLTAGEGEEAVWVVGHLTRHRIFDDLKLFTSEWMTCKEADEYFTNHQEYFGPEREGFDLVSDMLNRKSLSDQYEFEDVKLHLPVFNEVPVDMKKGWHLWLEIEIRPDLQDVPHVRFMSSSFSDTATRLKAQVFAEQKDRLKELVCMDLY